MRMCETVFTAYVTVRKQMGVLTRYLYIKAKKKSFQR